MNGESAMVDALLRRDGIRSARSLRDDLESLLKERRTLRWRLAEVQKLLDDGYDVAGDRRVIRVSRQIMTFILTGELPDTATPE